MLAVKMNDFLMNLDIYDVIKYCNTNKHASHLITNIKFWGEYFKHKGEEYFKDVVKTSVNNQQLMNIVKFVLKESNKLPLLVSLYSRVFDELNTDTRVIILDQYRKNNNEDYKQYVSILHGRYLEYGIGDKRPYDYFAFWNLIAEYPIALFDVLDKLDEEDTKQLVQEALGEIIIDWIEEPFRSFLFLDPDVLKRIVFRLRYIKSLAGKINEDIDLKKTYDDTIEEAKKALKFELSDINELMNLPFMNSPKLTLNTVYKLVKDYWLYLDEDTLKLAELAENIGDIVKYNKKILKIMGR